MQYMAKMVMNIAETDGHMTRLDIISPVANQPGYHHHEWWNEKEGYGHGVHPDH